IAHSLAKELLEQITGDFPLGKESADLFEPTFNGFIKKLNGDLNLSLQGHVAAQEPELVAKSDFLKCFAGYIKNPELFLLAWPALDRSDNMFQLVDSLLFVDLFFKVAEKHIKQHPRILSDIISHAKRPKDIEDDEWDDLTITPPDNVLTRLDDVDLAIN